MWDYEQFTTELAAAVDRENLVRDAAMIGVKERIGEFQVMPMTVRHYLILKIARNPFLTRDRLPEEEDLAQLLLVLRPESSLLVRWLFWLKCREFCLPKIPRTAGALWKRIAEARTDHFVSLCKAAQEYVDETFQDRPPQDSNPSQDFYSEAASICAALAREYGGNPQNYMTTPLKVAFQYLNEIREMWAAKAGQKAMLFTPSDSVRRDFLNQLNSEQKN